MRGHFLSDEDIIAQEADFGKRKATGGRIGGAGGRSRPFGATMCEWSNVQLGGASEDAQSYWQGRFAACALVDFFFGVGRLRNSWGVAPNLTRGAASGLRKGQTKRDEVPP